MAEPHPPRIAQPEKRRAVGVLQVAVTWGNLERAVFVKAIVARIRGDPHIARNTIQPGVLRVGTLALEAVRSHDRRSISHLPHVAARPKRGNAQLVAVRISEHHVECDRVERIVMRKLRLERQLNHHVRRTFLCCFGETG